MSSLGRENCAAIVLASASPRRAEILDAMGLSYRVAASAVDETRIVGESADAMVVRLAVAKARAQYSAGEVCLGADTAVVLGEQVFGKPRDEAEAVAMLAELSGRQHRVVTGVAVVADGGTVSACSETQVVFRDIRPDEARQYWQTGEPVDKAGSYAIQGRGGIFVRDIKGSYSGVVGLPVFETARLLERSGVALFG